MKALILSGGKGTRLASVITDRPKPMAPVLGKPFLDYIISFLKESGLVTEVVLSVGYLSHVMQDYYGKHDLGIPISFIQEESPLGTGGAILNFQAQLNSLEQQYLVLNGDSFTRFDLTTLLRKHQEFQSAATLVLTRVKQVDRYGSVDLSEDDRVNKFIEKSECSSSLSSGLINAGIYLIDRQAFTQFQVKPCSFEKDILPPLIEDKKVFAIETKGLFLDIGIPEDYARAGEFVIDSALK